MSKLKPGKLQRKWLDALRSGKYVKGNHDLKRNGKHCVLGVLCEEFKEEFGIEEEWDETLQGSLFDGSSGSISTEIQEKICLRNHESEERAGKKVNIFCPSGYWHPFSDYFLPKVNDQIFAEDTDHVNIADWIEKNFDKYFYRSV